MKKLEVSGVMGTIIVFLVIVCIQLPALAQSDIMIKLNNLKPKDYPTKTIEVLIPYSPGGSSDVTARIIAKHLERYVDTSCVVVNKTGGGGLIGHTYFANQAENDGYTIGALTQSFLSDEILKAKGRWSYKNTQALAYIHTQNIGWGVSTKGPLKDKSIKEVIDMAKEKPNTLKVSIVSGITHDFILQTVEMASGAKFIGVPFQGGRPGVVAMLGGHVDIATDFYADLKSHLEAGEAKMLAISGTARSSDIPEIPTFNEVLGVDYINWATYRFVFVPKGVQRDRVNFLKAAIDAVLHDPEFIQDFKKLGYGVNEKYMTIQEVQDQVDRLYKSFKDFFIKTGAVSE
jgi:tripartite-type tricarboxylate transporter receptor subunit TctC